MKEQPETIIDEKPVGREPLGPAQLPRRNTWQIAMLVFSVVSIVIPAYVFFDNIQDLFSSYVEQDKKFQQEWLEQDTNEHGKQFEAIEDLKLEIINLKRDVKDVYQISQHLVKEKIPGIEERQDDIMEKIGDVEVECIRGAK